MTLSLDRHAASRLMLSLGVAAFAALAGACTTQADGSLDTQSSALTADDSADDAGGSAALEATRAACLTEFVGCIRQGDDEPTCGRALHECMPKPKRRRHPGRACEGGGEGGPPHPPGDGPPPPPPGADGAPPPPPPGAGDGDRPPPPPPGADGGPRPPGGPHRVCHEALVTCAKGTEAVEVCVADATACFKAAGPPPHPPGPPPPPPPPPPPGEAPPAAE